MNEREIQNAYKSNAELGASEVSRISRQLACTKRFLELVTMIPGARALAETDPDRFCEKYGLPETDPSEMRFLLDAEKVRPLLSLPVEEQLRAIPESVFRYQQFLGNKLHYRDTMLNSLCVPDNVRMRAWRARQIERLKAVCGQSYIANIHVPFNIELSSGCSVGCPFCAAGARKLQKVFRYTPENAALFSDVVRAARSLIGPAAGAGVLYYACEPLDNPDYERFADDFFTLTGFYPQITTAVALRNVPRTGRLLQRLATAPGTIFRFSLFSPEDTLSVMDAFSPEQLLRVELLPQYEEAPNFPGFVSAGRALENGDVPVGEKMFDSICCVSGFVVNLADRTVRLITAVNACERYPLGEIPYETAEFTDADDLRATMERMIEQYMPTACQKDLPLRIHPYFRIERDETGASYLRTPAYGIRLDKLSYWQAETVVSEILRGTYSKSELAKKLFIEAGVAPEKTYWVVSLLYRKGIIDELYQK